VEAIARQSAAAKQPIKPVNGCDLLCRYHVPPPGGSHTNDEFNGTQVVWSKTEHLNVQSWWPYLQFMIVNFS
jgi:hypothetical protein